MKHRVGIGVAVGLLALVGGLWLWPHLASKTALNPGSGGAKPLAAQVTASGATHGTAAVASPKAPTLNTNKLAYRLSNTTNTLRQLQSNPHAVLLANALIDTAKPLDLKIPKHLRSDGDPGAYIVQARGAISPAFRGALAGARAAIVSYIPNNAYLVNVSASGAAQLLVNPVVQSVLPYEPYYKLQPSLLGLAVSQQPLPAGTALTVGLFGADPTALADFKKLGLPIIGQDQSPFGPVVKVLPPDDWTTLAQLKEVQFMEPAFTRHIANDLSRVTLGISPDTTSGMTNDYAVDGYVLNGNNVLVAVNDTGVDAAHPDFGIGGSLQSPDSSSPPGRIKSLTPLDLVDTNGHGTHVAGIIAGNGSESLTMLTNEPEGSVPDADFRGKAPLAWLFSVNDANYSDYQLQTNAARSGALISNNSWDYGNGDSTYDLAAASYDFATRDAVPGQPGSQPMLFVFAAGNNGGGSDEGTGGSGDTIVSPGTAKNVITVGALEQLRDITNLVTTITEESDTNGQPELVTNQVAYWQPKTDSSDQVAGYSSRGNVGIDTEGPNGRFKPDVVVPGTFVVSTSSQFNHEWATNAYYNPTNDVGAVYTDQVVDTNALQYYNVNVPPNTVGVTISIYPNTLSPVPFTNLVIYCQQSGYPDPVNDLGAINLISYNNQVVVPPGNGNFTISDLQNNGGFYFAVGVLTNMTVNYDLTVNVLVTNDDGNLYSVLEGMNDSLGGYYRYESGTSMAAAGVSGVLALIEDYFTNKFQPAMNPSPALVKALLINGARAVGDYGIAFTNGINYEGWGQPYIDTSLPSEGLFDTADGSATGSTFFVEQNPSTALATGDSHTFYVDVSTNDTGSGLTGTELYLQATLVWTDPPGDPSAAIKLVNNLDLVVTNLDPADPNYGAVYVGNDIQPTVGYNLPWKTNGPPSWDTVNNVENVILPPSLGAKYSVTVIGRGVNVNAVSAQTNNASGQYAPNIVQDFALVIAVGEGEVTNAFTVTDGGLVSNPTDSQDFTQVMTTNAPLSDQLVGASSPLLGTNTLSLGPNTQWGSNGVITIGQTNQWHFYVVTNNGANAHYTNAGFFIFGVSTLSIPRMGVYESTVGNATTPEANLDLFVSQDPTLTNLNPAVIANCLAGANNSRAGLANAGTQFAFYTNSAPGQVYYVGVQSQDQMAAEYSFMPIFTEVPFSSLDQNGNQIVNGQLLPMTIPTGNNAHPGLTNVFALAVLPMEIEKVTVTNLDQHQNFGDLFGALEFSSHTVVLNNHDGFGDTFGALPRVYDDSVNRPLGTTKTDGPGSLTDYQAQSALGPWILSVLDNSAGGYTGQVTRLTLVIQPHRNLKYPGIYVSVPPGGWFYDWVDVPAGYTNLTFYGTNVTTGLPAGTPEIQMYELVGNDPTLTDYDQEATLTNGTPPGNIISVGPPLPLGRYFVGLYNPDVTTAQTVYLSATLGIGTGINDLFNYSSGESQPLGDDAVTPVPAPTGGTTPNPTTAGSTIIVPPTVTNLIATVNVGMVVDSPRISDYSFTLVSPNGQRVLLMENRGGGTTNGAGLTFIYTNAINSTASGGGAPQTNYLTVYPNVTGVSVPLTWNFYTVPDQMTIYGTTNPANFGLNSPFLLYNTGFVSNAPAAGGGGGQNTIAFTTNLVVPAGYTNITIIMNQFGNPYSGQGDAWTYTAGAPSTNYEYLMFTDDTNLTDVPIKFAPTPYSLENLVTNFALSDLDLATNGNYFGPTVLNDKFNGGWRVPTNIVTYSIIATNLQFVTVTNVLVLTNNLVSVVTDPTTALGGDAGVSNYLALGAGTITRSIPTIPGRVYNVTFWYRGPGIAAWWRGEGNANDSSDPENNNNNGQLIGRFNFPAGKVGQAFEFEDQGAAYEFAGTNTYVQVPASTSLNVGADGGFTVEGWINPTNLTRPEPLVEWLAKVPTNTATADTNLAIVQGPVLNRATGHYYYLLAATNWTTSELWAQSLGGNLVSLGSANENQWVYDTFTAYGTTNRDLWIGLRDRGTPRWLDGAAVTYTNWSPGQPGAACAQDYYVAILGPTNAYPGLWQLLDDAGQICGGVTNPVYGVVEVPTIQTNGVQFWVSGTNWTGASNTLQGALCANIVDTNFVSHWIYSAPGLLTSNVYQYVALTFNTNTGVASLYLNGTNVASSNLYSAGVSFVPKADGDVLLGYDLSLYTNNYYGGEMDEMSVYSRSLSLAEIKGIYDASADFTNGLMGKFDPAVTPSVGLAEALVTFGTSSNVIFGQNNLWEQNSYTFTAASNSMPLTISGVSPGILLDAFSVEEAPMTNVYYFPEQALSTLNGATAGGNWTLQVWDSRVGAYVQNVNLLVSWELSFVLVSNGVYAASLPPETPVASTVEPGQTVFYEVPVPTWAHQAINKLVSSDLPVDLLYYAPGNPPATALLPTATLLTGARSGSSAPISVSPVPPATQFGTYYLGVHNPGATAASVTLEVDFDIMALANGVPYTSQLTNEYSSERYFSFDVSSNAYESTFQLLQMNSNADLVISKGGPLPSLTSGAYGSFNNGHADQDIYVLTNSEPVPLSAGRWYLGVLNRGIAPVQYSVLAKELDLTGLALPTSVMPAIINLTNGVPITWTAGPGADLTNFFRFHVTNSVVDGANVFVSGLRFELYNLTGNGELTVQSNALPLAPPFYQTSQNGGTSPQLIFVFTNNVQTNLAGDWYLGVPNLEATNISYTIVAEMMTNLYFPAFPGAQGAGGGAAGGRFGDIVHVTTNADSGPYSLRYWIETAATNRTIVFDISGTINLASPLIITNSYLTIAGETAPGGGITVVGNLTTVTNAHDVVIRDLRFRSGAADDSFQFINSSNVIADHISAEWSSSHLVSVLNSSNVTVQWSILSQSLAASGSLSQEGSGSLSFHHNLYADNYTDSPRLGDSLTLDFVNNVVYNWGLYSGISDGTADRVSSPNGATNQLNYACNYLIAGADTAAYGANYAITNIAFYGGLTNAKYATWIFQTNNFIDSDTNGVLNGADTGWAMFTNDYTPFSHPFSVLPVAADEAYQAYEKVLDFAGVNLALRDAADTNIVTGVRFQTGRLLASLPASPTPTSLLPYLDTDQDGLPDFWEQTFTPKLLYVPSHNNDRNGDGYTDLEEYNNWLAAPHALTETNTPVGVDLYQLCGESGHLAFSITNSIHGTVYLTNAPGSLINTIAVFTPTNAPGLTNYYGYASFDFFATNLNTAAYIGPVTVSVIVSAGPITINSNFPPVVTPLFSGAPLDPTNYGGAKYYSIEVPAGTAGALFEIKDATGPLAMVVGPGPILPTLSSCAYSTNLPAWPMPLQIAVLTNSSVPLTPGTWYMGAVSETNSPVIYTAEITLLGSLLPPEFIYPANGVVITDFETAPLVVDCQAIDPNTPALPLSFALVRGPAGLTVSSAGVLDWTPTEEQAPSTNAVQVSVSNGAYSITNSFAIVVEVSNIPPVLPTIPNQLVTYPGTLVVTNTAINPNIPDNPLTYQLTAAPAGAAIDANGIITWTPTLAQEGSTHLITTVVTDSDPGAVNGASVSSSNSFYVTVLPPVPPGGGPQTNVVPPESISWFVVHVPDKVDMATNTLVFASAPVNLWFSTNLPPSITNGATEDTEFLTNVSSGVRVITAASVPVLVPQSVYFLGVQNQNTTPVTAITAVTFHYLSPDISDFSVVHTNLAGTNGYLIRWSAPDAEQFHLQWTTALVPARWVNFNGVISDSPSVVPPSGNFQYFDDGSQTRGLGTTRFYRLVWLDSPSNTAPFFVNSPNPIYFASPLVTFLYTNLAKDWDLPAQTLSYSVSNSLAVGNLATIDSTGLISWTPTLAQVGLTNVITTTVTDSGVPMGVAVNSISVVVVTNTVAPVFRNITVNGTGVTFNWTAPASDQFSIRWTTNLALPNWQFFPSPITSTTSNFTFVDTNRPLSTMKFYQLILLP